MAQRAKGFVIGRVKLQRAPNGFEGRLHPPDLKEPLCGLDQVAGVDAIGLIANEICLAESTL